LYEWKKYWDYVFDTESYAPRFGADGVSDRALEAVRQVRDAKRPPAIVIHGIMPRSGTVYVGELLRLHPALCAYPGDLFEIPFLQLAGDIQGLQRRFLLGHRHNAGKLGERDFLALFGAAFLAYLEQSVLHDKRALLKVPSVQYLSDFYTAFPHEHLLVLVRDGRDVVQSTIKTWPQLRFSFVCRRWRRSAEMVLACHERYARRDEGYWLARFEDAVRDPAAFVREACSHFGLDVARYPFERIGEIAVRGSSSIQAQDGVTWQAVDRPAGFDPTGRWQGWSGRKRRVFKRIAGQALIDLGYCDDSSW
jgi:protein-tyrosine sulfotransferase